MIMEISVIASGSNGNCCLVEDRDASVLIDAGKSGREIESRLSSLGKSMEDVDAVLLTHSHSDHVSGAGVLSRRYSIPVYMTRQVFAEASARLRKIDARHFSLKKSFRIKDMKIRPVPTSHNVSSCGFVIKKLGVFTDTGTVTDEMKKVMPGLSTVLLESNHDIDMVIKGPYPYFLKNWILSDIGHLSNIHACGFIQEHGKNLSLALLGHLSGNNNTPEMATKTFEALVKRKFDFRVCSREKASGSWNIDGSKRR
ncbi:MBL fold metallo-hydrolase [Candidatus Woesearchaeota archaeon]|nr:MBL fold metallo-hydrolase [Candidatus Woesearchaeota archaeon]